MKASDVIEQMKSNKKFDPIKKIEDLGQQIGKLKAQNQSKDNEIKRLKESINTREANQPRLGLEGNSLEFLYSTRVQGKVFSHLKKYQMHDNFSKLYNLIRPLVNITNALVRGQDIFSKEPRYEIGKDGKPDVNRRAKDAEGKPAFMPSPIERFTRQLDEFLALPGVGELLNRLNDEYQRVLSESPKRSSSSQPSKIKDNDPGIEDSVGPER